MRDPNGNEQTGANEASAPSAPRAGAHAANDRNEAQGDVSAQDHLHVIAIDGPAGAGKTTVAVRLADRLGAVALDTGLLYRAATVLAHRHGLTPGDGIEVARRIEVGAIRVRPASVADGRLCDVLVDGEDVTTELRTAEIDRTVSAISALPAVRASLLPLQRRIAAAGKVVMVGRDITSVVAPNAGVRIYLNASPGERALRRWRELADAGSEIRYEEVLADLERRDRIDSSRETAPLAIADGATIVETDGKSIDDVVDEIVAIVEGAWAA
jgi:cytidylate kinase